MGKIRRMSLRHQPPKTLRCGDLMIREEKRRRVSDLGEFHLTATYPGFDREIDARLFKAAGGYSHGSGFWFTTKMRDHDWYFKTRAKALAARARISKLAITGLKVKLVGPLP